MIFAKVDVCLPTHPKFIQAGLEATGYWVAALAYVRAHELDGVLPEAALGVLLGVGLLDGKKQADRLVSAGLFERVTDGYLIINYASKNETKAQIQARRVATRERVQRFRCNGVTHGVTNATVTPACNASSNINVTACVTRSVPGSDSDSLSDLRSEISEGEHEREPDRPSRPATDDGAFGLAVSAWADGIRSVTGRPCHVARGGPTAQLIEVLAAHRPADAEPVEWTRQQATDYATARAGERLSVFGFGDWLNSGKPDRASGVRRVEVQPVPVTGRVWKLQGGGQ